MNWKTTLIGLGEAVVIAVAGYVAGAMSGDYTLTGAGIALAVLRALGAYFTKDKDVTGGTRAQGAPSAPESACDRG